LWDPEIDGVSEIKVFLECTMVLCSVPAFAQPTTPESICKLPENSCQNRYDNLQSSLVRRSATLRDEDNRQKVERSETEQQSSELIFKRNVDGMPTDNPSDNPSSACTMVFSTLLMVIFGFV